uniref:G-protein coupled receptors family 1 profile domain-containing protein n=1 Tax=Strongyloides stercoralis TaxID=6248 RepID=A0A0K0E3X1_STRER
MSLYYSLTTYVALIGFFIGIKNTIVGIANLILLNPEIITYSSPTYCRIKAFSDGFIIQAYSISVTVRVILFIVMIKFPFFYKYKIETPLAKKILWFYLLLSSFLCGLVTLGTSFNRHELVFCNMFSVGKIEDSLGIFINFIFIVVIIFPLQLLAILSFKRSQNNSIKKGILSVMLYTDITYLLAWGIPSVTMVILNSLKMREDIINITQDLNIITVCFAAFLEFPFNYYKNTEFKKYAQKYVIYSFRKRTITI